MKSSEILTIVLTTFFSFIAATAGSYLASHLEQTNWEKRNEMEMRKAIFEKRVNALERFLGIANKASIALNLAYFYQDRMDTNKCKQQGEENRYICDHMTPSENEKMIEIHKEIDDLNSEFDVALALTNTYFGEETQNLAAKFIRDPGKTEVLPWWRPENTKLMIDINKAMKKELIMKN